MADPTGLMHFWNVTAQKSKSYICVWPHGVLSFVTLCLHTATMMEPSLSLASRQVGQGWSWQYEQNDTSDGNVCIVPGNVYVLPGPGSMNTSDGNVCVV